MGAGRSPVERRRNSVVRHRRERRSSRAAGRARRHLRARAGTGVSVAAWARRGGLLLVGGGLGGAMLLGRSAPVVGRSSHRCSSASRREALNVRRSILRPLVELSRIFETTRGCPRLPGCLLDDDEIRALGSMSSLEQNVPRAKRGFAPPTGSSTPMPGWRNLLRGPDADLRAFITSTRSRDWQDT